MTTAAICAKFLAVTRKTASGSQIWSRRRPEGHFGDCPPRVSPEEMMMMAVFCGGGGGEM